MAWAQVGALSMWYLTRGEGHPLVLLHGLGSSSADWLLQMPSFALRYRVIAPDLRGHGRTPLAAPSLSIEQMAADVIALLEHLQALPAYVLGFSMGGCVALSLALQRPEEVRGLVLANTGAVLRPSGRRILRGLVRLLALYLLGPSVMARVVARGLFSAAHQSILYRAAIERLGRTPRRTYQAAIQAILRFDARPHLHRIRCPTLVITGARDPTIDPRQPRVLAAGIPDARLVVIPDSGHATPIDQPVRFNRAVLEFLDGVAGRSRADRHPRPLRAQPAA